MINTLLSLLFPEQCPVCKRSSRDHKTAPLCSGCWEGIVPYNGPLCKKCGKPLVSEVSRTCGYCLEEPPAFKWVRGYGIYEGTLKKAVNLFKYQQIKRLSRPLTELIIKNNGMLKETFHRAGSPDDTVFIPVPLYRGKLRKREFNQSALLARHVAKATGSVLLLNCLSKIKETIPQVGLTAKERRKNVRKAFRVLNEKLIKDKNVILIDDVFTTGATLRECSQELKKAGARDIFGVTLAHNRGDF
jgi:ComF family protein